MSDSDREAVLALGRLIEETMGTMPEKEWGNLVYDLMKERNLESADFFTLVYKALIGKEKGPRLVSFLHTIGKEKASALLK